MTATIHNLDDYRPKPYPEWENTIQCTSMEEFFKEVFKKVEIKSND